MLAAMALVAAVAATPQQFDLVCSGTRKTISAFGPVPTETKPWKERFIIDLQKGIVAYSPAAPAFDLAGASDGSIVVYDDRDDFRVRKLTIDRYSGSLYSTEDYLKIGEHDFIDAKCTPDRFSGLSSHKF